MFSTPLVNILFAFIVMSSSLLIGWVCIYVYKLLYKSVQFVVQKFKDAKNKKEVKIPDWGWID